MSNEHNTFSAEAARNANQEKKANQQKNLAKEFPVVMDNVYKKLKEEAADKSDTHINLNTCRSGDVMDINPDALSEAVVEELRNEGYEVETTVTSSNLNIKWETKKQK